MFSSTKIYQFECDDKTMDTRSSDSSTTMDDDSREDHVLPAKRRKNDDCGWRNAPRHKDVMDIICERQGCEEDSEMDGQDQVFSSWLVHPCWASQFQQNENNERTSTNLLRAEIQSLSRQLNQVKRRLFPAAEQCVASSSEPEYGIYQQTARREFNQARSRCNPFEALGERGRRGLGSLFLNRAAVKLANIDALINFELTAPSIPAQYVYDSHRPFVFVDLCGAPGGFSEYVIGRCESEGLGPVKGYGMSLIGSNEHGDATPWKLNSSTYLQNSCLQQYRICEGADGTGDVFVWENVQYLINLMKHDCHHQKNNVLVQSTENEDGRPFDTEDSKAHLVMADGGFDAQRDCEDQEAIAQKLIVCEAAAALACLRRGGTFVMKMFGTQTDVVRAVVADLQNRYFEDLIVVKPISSRPASAERYLVGRGFRGLESNWDGPSWKNRMFLGESFGQSRLTTDYFDIFDRDMLQLNLKSCFAILTHLQNRHAAAAESDDHGWTDDTPSILIRSGAYKRAWRLC